ncbi:MAG TPA: hypothetical protein PKD55_00435 [Bellilinea sp.]|nr:hypothetical protein [Bellilinea sp.]
MSRTSVIIANTEMQAVLRALAEELEGDLSWSVVGDEIVYQILYPGQRVVKIFSSVDRRTFMTRERNEDAIRVVYKTPVSGWHKTARVYRVAGWDKRLRERVWEATKLVKQMPVEKQGCIYCGNPDLASTDPELCKYHLDTLQDGKAVLGYW